VNARLVAGAAGPLDGSYDVDIVILALQRTEETLAAIASASSQIGVSAHIFVLDQGSCSQALVHPAGDPNPLWQATPPMACLSSSSGTALPLWH
jgi:hypothetical protein